MRRLTTFSALVVCLPMARAQQSPLRYSVPSSAVSSALAGRSIALSPDHIRLPSPVPSAVSEPVLQLLALDLQPDGNLAARLSCQAAAVCRPFFATLLLPDREQALSVLDAFRKDTLATPTINTRQPGVSVGSVVTLRLADRQMRIQLQGIAIDTAPPGRQIRVASLDRRHTYRGIVVNTTTVEGDLP